MNVSRLIRYGILVYFLALVLVTTLLGVDDYRAWADEHEGWSALLAAPPFLVPLAVDLLRRRVGAPKPPARGRR
jgi:hypothetical protein